MVNNAGSAGFGPFMDGDVDTELGRVQVNVVAPIMLARIAGYQSAVRHSAEETDISTE